jgi:hypothetical protein
LGMFFSRLAENYPSLPLATNPDAAFATMKVSRPHPLHGRRLIRLLA